MTNKVLIRAAEYIHGESSKGKQWAKHVTSIDSSMSNGYAFIGEWVPKRGETELPLGSLILTVGYHGSWKNGELEARILRVDGENQLTQVGDEYYIWAEEKVTIRRHFEKLLGGEQLAVVNS